jgi:hypothetical protein
MTVPAQAPGSKTDAGAGLGSVSLREVLAAYDREVDEALAAVDGATSGEERVRALLQAQRVLAVHDAIVAHALCPLLEELPDGAALAARLREGVAARGELLGRFDRLVRGVAPRNVYAASGQEIETVVEALEESVARHVEEETREVGDLLERARASVDPVVLAAKMAIEAQRAPTRAHPGAGSGAFGRLRRLRDQVADWVDAHHGWFDPWRERSTPRGLQSEALRAAAASDQPTVRDLLAGYDRAVASLVEEWRRSSGPSARLDAARRMAAAITVHDSVLAGVLCPLLTSLPGAEPAAAELRQGCEARAELVARVERLLGSSKTPDEAARSELEDLVAQLAASFEAHEATEGDDVGAVLSHLGPEDYRTLTSPLADVAWPWHSEGPSVLALRMALWAEGAPTRVHPLLARYPQSQVLRRVFHLVDQWRDFWADTPVQRWLAPPRPPAPYRDAPMATARPGTSGEAAPEGAATVSRPSSEGSSRPALPEERRTEG